MRAREKLSERDLPERHNPETSKPDIAGKKGLLTLRAAVILGASLALAVAAGTLTYLSGPRHVDGMPTAAIAAAAAVFAAVVKLLDAIIAD
jgi:hypothetical protein